MSEPDNETHLVPVGMRPVYNLICVSPCMLEISGTESVSWVLGEQDSLLEVRPVFLCHLHDGFTLHME